MENELIRMLFKYDTCMIWMKDSNRKGSDGRESTMASDNDFKRAGAPM